MKITLHHLFFLLLLLVTVSCTKEQIALSRLMECEEIKTPFQSTLLRCSNKSTRETCYIYITYTESGFNRKEGVGYTNAKREEHISCFR